MKYTKLLILVFFVASTLFYFNGCENSIVESTGDDDEYLKTTAITTLFDNSDDPDHLTFGFPQNCEECHTTVNWESPDFDHIAVSGFALNGAHRTAQCTSCHINNQISGLPRDCFGCHENDYIATTNPSHLQANFSQ